MRIYWNPVRGSDLFSEQMAEIHSPEYGHIILQLWISPHGDYTTRISAPGCRPVQRCLTRCRTLKKAMKHAVMLLTEHFPETDTNVSDDCINQRCTHVPDMT